MKVFTNATKTRFFSTDYHVRHLHELEINTVKELMTLIRDVDVNVLIGNRFFQADDIGELLITEDDGINPVKPFQIDFLEGMTFAEILASALNSHEYTETAQIIFQIKALWKYAAEWDGGREVLLFIASDGSKLLVDINHFAAKIKTTTYLKTTNLALLPSFYQPK